MGGEALPALQRRNGTACDGKALRNQTGQQRYHADSPASNRARHTHSTVSLTSKGKGAAVSVSRRDSPVVRTAAQIWATAWNQTPHVHLPLSVHNPHTLAPPPTSRRRHSTTTIQRGIYKPLMGGGTAGYKRVIHSWHVQPFPTACIATEPRTIAHFVQLRAASPP